MSFYNTVNNATAIITSPHTIGDNVLNINPIGIFGSGGFPIRVTCFRQSDGANVIYAIGSSGATSLNIIGVLENTADINLAANDVCQSEITAGAFRDIHNAINAINASGGGSSSGVPIVGTSGAVPIYGNVGLTEDTNFFYDQANNRLSTKGLVITGSGTDWKTPGGNVLSRVDSVGTFINDMTLNDSLVMWKTIPQASGYPVSFNHAMSSTSATGVFGNTVYSLGWNVGGGGQRQNLAHPTFRLGFEYNYEIAGEEWMEGHLFACINPINGNETRPFSVVFNKSQGYKCDTLMQGDSWTWSNSGQTYQIAQLARTNHSVYYKISGSGASDALGYPFQLISDAVTPADTILIGRNFARNNSVTIQGITSTSITLKTGGVSDIFLNDGGFTFLADPTHLMFFRSNDIILSNRNISRLAFRAQDDGANMAIGFYGAATIVKPSGDVATALNSLGLITNPAYVSPITSVTTNTTLTVSNDMVLANANSAPIVITLPNATTIGNGREFTIKKIDSTSNVVAISGVSAQTIDGSVVVSISTQWQSYTIKSFSGAWYIK